MQVLLTTPTTPNERMEKIAQASEGFIYLVSFSDSVATCKKSVMLHHTSVPNT